MKIDAEQGYHQFIKHVIGYDIVLEICSNQRANLGRSMMI